MDPVSGDAGCGFYVGRDDFRYGLALQPFSSVLSAELYAIFRAIHYSSRAGMNKVLVASDSRAALSALRDCLAAPVRNYLVFRIAHMLEGLRDQGRVVEFVWVPGHVTLRPTGSFGLRGSCRSASGMAFLTAISSTRSAATTKRGLGFYGHTWGRRVPPTRDTFYMLPVSLSGHGSRPLVCPGAPSGFSPGCAPATNALGIIS